MPRRKWTAERRNIHSQSHMKLSYTFVIAAAILLGFLTLSYSETLNGRYSAYFVAKAKVVRILDTRTGQMYLSLGLWTGDEESIDEAMLTMTKHVSNAKWVPYSPLLGE